MATSFQSAGFSPAAPASTEGTQNTGTAAPPKAGRYVPPTPSTPGEMAERAIELVEKADAMCFMVTMRPDLADVAPEVLSIMGVADDLLQEAKHLLTDLRELLAPTPKRAAARGEA